MGLLDDLLANVSGEGTERAPQERSAAGGRSNTLRALLPIVLAMLAQGRGGARQPGGGASMDTAPGGLGGLLGSLLGGAGTPGGLGALIERFQRAGLGAEAGSWVSRGPNQPLSGDGLEKVFGRDALTQIARHAGISEAEASRGLSDLLPEVVDQVTPEGNVPPADALAASVDAFARRYGVR